jgi:hypothetical protein
MSTLLEHLPEKQGLIGAEPRQLKLPAATARVTWGEHTWKRLAKP